MPRPLVPDLAPPRETPADPAAELDRLAAEGGSRAVVPVTRVEAVAWRDRLAREWGVDVHVLPTDLQKKPAARQWQTRAASTREGIGALWGPRELCLGVACGLSGVFVLDLDVPLEDVETAVDPAQRALGALLRRVIDVRQTRVLRSSGRGLPHFVWRQTDPAVPQAKLWRLQGAGDLGAERSGSSIGDLRSVGGQVVISGHDPIVDVQVAHCPPDVVEAIMAVAGTARSSGVGTTDGTSVRALSEEDVQAFVYGTSRETADGVSEAERTGFVQQLGVSFYRKLTEDGGSHRHDAMYRTMKTAFIEALAGGYPLDQAVDLLESVYREAYEGGVAGRAVREWLGDRDEDFLGIVRGRAQEAAAGLYDDLIVEKRREKGWFTRDEMDAMVEWAVASLGSEPRPSDIAEESDDVGEPDRTEAITPDHVSNAPSVLTETRDDEHTGHHPPGPVEPAPEPTTPAGATPRAEAERPDPGPAGGQSDEEPCPECDDTGLYCGSLTSTRPCSTCGPQDAARPSAEDCEETYTYVPGPEPGDDQGPLAGDQPGSGRERLSDLVEGSPEWLRAAVALLEAERLGTGKDVVSMMLEVAQAAHRERVRELGREAASLLRPSATDVSVGLDLSVEYAEPGTYLGGLVPHGSVTLMFGASGSFKTMLALLAVIEVLEAGGTVLHLDWEMGVDKLVPRLQALGLSQAGADRLVYVWQPGDMLPDMDRYRGYRADLVVMDSVTRALNASASITAGGSNDNDAFTRWTQTRVEPLIEAGLEGSLAEDGFGAAVLLIDHVGHDEATRVRGASAKKDAVSQLLSVKKDRNLVPAEGQSGMATVTVRKSRLVDLPEDTQRVVELVPSYPGGGAGSVSPGGIGTGRLRLDGVVREATLADGVGRALVSEDAEDRLAETNDALVLAAILRLGASGAAVTREQVRHDVGIKKDRVGQSVERLLAAGRLESVGRGVRAV